MRRLVLLALAVTALTAGCRIVRHSPEDELALTPAQWDGFARGHPACEDTARLPDAGWTAWTLQRPRGMLRLPDGAKELPTGNHSLRRWALPDSGHFEVRISPEPAGGLAVTGAEASDIAECMLPVAGHAALVTTIRAVVRRSRDTSYVATVDVFVERGLALDVMLDARSPEARAQLLAAVAGLRLDGSSR